MMKIKYFLCFLLPVILFQTGLSRTTNETNKPPHGTGLLYQDPRTIPWLIEIKEVPVLPGARVAHLVQSVDLSSQMPPVGDQGFQGSCVGWAFGYYHKTHTEWIEHSWNVNLPSNQYSPAFIYNQINGGIDGGSYFSHAMALICSQGDANMVLCPYNVNNWTTWPSETAYSYAIPFRGDSACWFTTMNTSDLQRIKQRLNNGYTTVLGIRVWTYFDTIENYNNTYCVADFHGNFRGNHAVTIVGYDDNRPTNDGLGAFKIVNSWGTGWGTLGGYFWMSYVAVMNSTLCQRYAYYVTDLISYQPRLLGRVQITHQARDKIGIRLGVGRTTSPLWSFNFRPWRFNETNRPFPSNRIVFDMTEGAQFIENWSTDSVFVRCVDDSSDGITGSISYFSSQHLPLNAAGVSPDPPVSIPDVGVGVYARAKLNLSKDVGCTELIAPTGIVEFGTVITPACSVYNYGATIESYPVRMKIGNSYNNITLVSNHIPGTYRYVTFPNWNANQLGLLAVCCSTELNGDVMTWDDRRRGTVFVYEFQFDTAWVRRYNGPGNLTDEAYAIAKDGAGNIYVTGRSVGSGSTYDFATIKYNANGIQQWVARYNGPGNDSDYANAIAVDGVGNVYVTGNSYGSGTGYDYATIKYNPNGDTLWVRRYNGPGNSTDYALEIAVDGVGNVYVTGYSYSSGTSTSADYATIKYNTNGIEQWVARYNGPGNSTDYASGIAIDGSSNVYVTGRTRISGSDYDYATIKYTANGDTQWVRRYNGPGNSTDNALAIGTDGSGNAYVTGRSTGSGTDYDYATIKYTTNGDTQWVRRYNGPGNSADYASDLAVDGSGNVYVTGRSGGSGTGVDYATIKYNPSGVEQWVGRYNGAVNGGDYAQAIALDGIGNVYVTGYSEGSGTSNDYATIMYNPDGVGQWVARYNGPGNNTDYAYAITVDGSGNAYVTGGSFGSSNNADYATIRYVKGTGICIPDTIGALNSLVAVPIMVSDVTNKGIIGCDIILTWNASWLTADSAYFGSVVPGGWSGAYNYPPDTVKIAMAGSNPLAGSGSLLWIRFHVSSSAPPGASTTIHFSRCDFNEGSVPTSTDDGLFTVQSIFSISGYSKYYWTPFRAVPNTKMNLTGGQILSTLTDVNGYYIFSNLTGSLNYTVTPEKTNTVNSPYISSYDAALILQHVVGMITLNPSQQIAADVSGNGSISAYDAALVLQYSIGVVQHFPSGDWKFQPTSISYTSLNSNQTNQNYAAILCGDVTGNWQPTDDRISIMIAPDNLSHHGNLPEREENEEYRIQNPEKLITDKPNPSLLRAINEKLDKHGFSQIKKDVVTRFECPEKNSGFLTVPITIANVKDAISADIVLTYNPNEIKIKDVTLGNATAEYLYAWATVGNTIRIALAGTRAINDNVELVKVNYELQTKEITSAVTEANSSGSSGPVQIQSLILNEGKDYIAKKTANGVSGSNTVLPTKFDLMTNQPNPFNTQTSIHYSLPLQSRISLRIYDINGTLVKTLLNTIQNPGFYSTHWDGTDELNLKVPCGIYILRFSSKDITLTRKLVIEK